MKEVHFSATDFTDSIIDVLVSDFPVFLFEFSGVYGLMASNSIKGVEAIHNVKKRLPGKFYSSCLGDLGFFENVKNPLLNTIKNQILSVFEGAFIRVKVADDQVSNAVVYNGYHQILIENEQFRRKIQLLDAMLSTRISPSPFFDFSCFSLLCSSANISGSINGGIRNRQEAIEFGITNNIPLIIHTDYNQLAQGSYPVFKIDEQFTVSIQRNGFKDQEILHNAQQLFQKLKSIK